MRIKLTIFFCSLLFLSCQSKMDIENQVIECIENDINRFSIYPSGQVFDTFKEFETFLIDEHILNGIQNSDYIDLIDTAQNKDYSQIVPDDRLIVQFSPSNLFHAHKHCNIEIMRKHRDHRLELIVEAYDAFEASGTTDFNHLKKIIKNMNFKNDKSRSIATALLYYNLFDR